MSPAPNDPVRREDNGPVTTLTLDRPENGNALSEAMMDALEDHLRALANDGSVRVIILAARGKIFSAGHDLREMRNHEDEAYFEALFARCSRLMISLRDCPKPIIAKVQGAAVAAGCQLVASCDLAFAADSARLGVSGINLGLFCATPAVPLSRAVARKHALDLLLTGRLISAARAAEIGLINAAVPAAELDQTVAEVAELIAAKLPAALSLGKHLFYRQLEMELPEAYALAGEKMAENMGYPETRELIDGFLRSR